MTTNTTAQIATFLNVSPNQIKSVTEMAWVFCVVVRGCRARFVSKKVVKSEVKMSNQVSRSEAAKLVANAVDCTTKIWEKGDKVRVYLSHRGKDYGFVAITSNGLDFNLSGYGGNTYGRMIREAMEGITIKQESFREQMIRTASQPNSIQDSWEAYHRQHPVREYCYGAADEESF